MDIGFVIQNFTIILTFIPFLTNAIQILTNFITVILLSFHVHTHTHTPSGMNLQFFFQSFSTTKMRQVLSWLEILITAAPESEICITYIQ